MKVEIAIGPVNGPVDPPPFSIVIRSGKDIMRVEVLAEDLALALSGRLIPGEVTRATGRYLGVMERSEK